MNNVLIPSPLRSYTGNRSQVAAVGATVAEILGDLDRRYPGIRFRVIDEQDRIRQHMNFFVAGDRTRDLSHPLAPGQEVHILGALSGG